MSLTPKYLIVRQLRQLWMRSREKSAAMKRDNYSCVCCGVKKSVAKGKEQKIEVHHKKGEINWDKLVKVLREDLLCSVDDLETLCPDCHDKKGQ